MTVRLEQAVKLRLSIISIKDGISKLPILNNLCCITKTGRLTRKFIYQLNSVQWQDWLTGKDPTLT